MSRLFVSFRLYIHSKIFFSHSLHDLSGFHRLHLWNTDCTRYSTRSRWVYQLCLDIFYVITNLAFTLNPPLLLFGRQQVVQSSSAVLLLVMVLLFFLFPIYFGFKTSFDVFQSFLPTCTLFPVTSSYVSYTYRILYSFHPGRFQRYCGVHCKTAFYSHVLPILCTWPYHIRVLIAFSQCLLWGPHRFLFSH